MNNYNVLQLADLNSGIQDKAMDISLNTMHGLFPLRKTSYNFTFGKYEGISSRYGISPIQGHMSSDDGDTISGGFLDGYRLRNLISSEKTRTPHSTSGVDLFGDRKGFYGAVIVQRTIEGEKKPVVYWITSKEVANGYQINLTPSAETTTNGQGVRVVSKFEAPLMPFNSSYVFDEDNALFNATDRLQVSNTGSLRLFTSNPKFIRFSVLSQKIRQITENYVVHKTGTDVAGNPQDGYFGFLGYPFGEEIPREKQDFTVRQSASSVGFTWTGSFLIGEDISYSYQENMHPISLYQESSGKVSFSEGTWGYSDNTQASSYYFVNTKITATQTPLTYIGMVINNKPIMALINEQVKDSLEYDNVSDHLNPPSNSGDALVWVDPSSNPFPDAITGSYTESWNSATAEPKNTCWYNAPEFIHGANTLNCVADSGTLRGKTVYEYAYSIFNTITGKESNVGKPAKAWYTSDNFGIKVHSSSATMLFGAQDSDSLFPSLQELFDIEGADVWSKVPINMFIYRMYYREVGSFEWLYAGEVSFADLYFNPERGDIVIGRTNIIGNIGGQVGGYFDYSNLPKDKYIDVSTYDGRMFWATKEIIRFSDSVNPLNYPIVNYLRIPAGEIRGVIPHYFAGQAEQTGRLVVFTNKGSFDVRRTGNFEFIQVRVSATAQPQSVPVDGSNLKISARSDNTAFSSRCAAVAEGVLYYWGESGIFRDDGVSLPERISDPIEPELFNSYDRNETGKFFAFYAKNHQEVIFFYVPIFSQDSNPNGFLTKAWVYSIRAEKIYGKKVWSQYGYDVVIDWIQELELSGFAGQGAGQRALIGSRESRASEIQRPYFHDRYCTSGDYKPNEEIPVKELRRIDDDTLRLVLAGGYSDEILSYLGSNSVIRVTDSFDNAEINLDGELIVKSTDRDNGYIDVSDSTSQAVVLSPEQYFPVFTQRHGINFVIESNFISPYGLTDNVLFRFAHFYMRPVVSNQNIYPQASLSWICQHRQADETSVDVYMGKNEEDEESTQNVVDLQSSSMEAQGQGIKLKFSFNDFFLSGFTIHAILLWHDRRNKRDILKYSNKRR